jgi:hypothetical protein
LKKGVGKMDKKPLIGFVKKPVIVYQTVIHLSPEAFDFIERHTDRSKTATAHWEAKNVIFGIASSSVAESGFSDAAYSSSGRPRLFLNREQCRGKRVVLEEVLKGANLLRFTDQHRADLEVALKELADAVRAEATVTGFALDLQAF